MTDSITEQYGRDGAGELFRVNLSGDITLHMRQVEQSDEEQPADEDEEVVEIEQKAVVKVAEADGGVDADDSSLVLHSLSMPPMHHLLPAELLPLPDPACHPEESALDGSGLPDYPLSDIWQACGYHHLSDLMPDNIMRALTPGMEGSEQARASLEEIQRCKVERMARAGVEQPVVTVEQVDAMAKEHLKRFQTKMDSRRCRLSAHLLACNRSSVALSDAHFR